MSALPQSVGSGLTLRSVTSPADRQRYIDLNAAVTNEGPIAARLLDHQPTTTDADYWLVINEATGAAVSTTCLIPWRCTLDGIQLTVAMLEMVVTDPAYRQRGLVRAQLAHFHTVVAKRGFDLSIIQGIPYYYRQYGYSYAIDHTPLTTLAVDQIPARATDAPRAYQFRAATLADSATLTRLYHAAMAQHHFSMQRTTADWHYLLAHKAHPVQLIVEEETEQAVGYFVPATQGATLRLYEHAVFEYAAGMALFQALQAEKASSLQLAGPPSDRLVALAHTLGGVAEPVADQWLWRIPDVGALLTRLTPLFARRLQAAGCGDYTGTICINLYRQAFLLRINRGAVQVEAVGFVDASLGAAGGDLDSPPAAFIRLLLGYRSLDQLRDAWPDLRVKPATRYLVEILFPRLDAHILMPY